MLSLINHTPRIQEALALVHSAYEKCIEKDAESSIPRAFFTIRLNDATTKYIGLDEPDIEKAMAEYWHWHFDSSLRVLRTSAFQAQDIDNYVKLLCVKNIVTEHTRQYPVANTLAYLCMIRLNMAASQAPIPEENNIFHLVDKWVGKRKLDWHVSMLEHLVNRLYGPACWSLCRDEVETDVQLPFHLWKMEYPISVQNEHVLITEQLPSDMI